MHEYWSEGLKYVLPVSDYVESHLTNTGFFYSVFSPRNKIVCQVENPSRLFVSKYLI